MKKLNNKQIEYSRKKVRVATARVLKTFLFSILCVLAVIFTVTLASGALNLDSALIFGGAGSYALLVTMASIGDQSELPDRYSIPNQIGPRIWLISRNQINDAVAYPNANDDREITTIPLKAGEYMHYFDLVDTYPRDTSTGERQEFSTNVTNDMMIAVRGNTKKIMDFLEEYSGTGFILIYQECEGGEKYVRGSFCKPMNLQSWNRKNDNEGKYVTMSFQNTHWRQPLVYVGDIVREAAVTVAAGLTNLAVTQNGQYILSDHSASVAIATVSGIASSDIGRTIDIIAPATALHAPTIADNSVFILKGGATWTANPGSRITFKIFDSNTLTEVARVQTA